MSIPTEVLFSWKEIDGTNFKVVPSLHIMIEDREYTAEIREHNPHVCKCGLSNCGYAYHIRGWATVKRNNASVSIYHKTDEGCKRDKTHTQLSMNHFYIKEIENAIVNSEKLFNNNIVNVTSLHTDDHDIKLHWIRNSSFAYKAECSKNIYALVDVDSNSHEIKYRYGIYYRMYDQTINLHVGNCDDLKDGMRKASFLVGKFIKALKEDAYAF